MIFLPPLLFCTLRGQRSDLICFSPTYFWKCVCAVSLKSTLQTLLPKSLSVPLMCGECCLSAPLFCLLLLLQTQSPTSFTCLRSVQIISAVISFACPVLCFAPFEFFSFRLCPFPFSQNFHAVAALCSVHKSPAVKSQSKLVSLETYPLFIFFLFQFSQK